MSDNQNAIQSIYNSQEEIERIAMGLSIANGRLYAKIIQKDEDPRNTPEYKMVAEGYYGLLQNVDHLISLDIERDILPSDPKQRADKVSVLIKQSRLANIGRIGSLEASV
jgi:hypothetical protein